MSRLPLFLQCLENSGWVTKCLGEIKIRTIAAIKTKVGFPHLLKPEGHLCQDTAAEMLPTPVLNPTRR